MAITDKHYEVHPDNEGQWLLYEVGDGGFDLVATFADREDAEFARQAFGAHDGPRVGPATDV